MHSESLQPTGPQNPQYLKTLSRLKKLQVINMQNTRSWAMIWTISLTVTLLLASAHQYYLSVVQPDVPYMDTLRLIFQVDDWQTGKSTLYQLWADHAAHRGLVMETLLIANMEIFGLDVELANRLTGIVILACSAFLVSIFLRDCSSAATRTHSRADWLVITTAAILLGALGFGLSGFELLTLDLGLPQWFKNLIFLLCFWLHGALLTRPSRKQALVVSLLMPIIVLLIGMGWSYAFVAAIFVVHGLAHAARVRSGASYEAYIYLPLFSAAISIMLYLFGGPSGEAEGSALSAIGKIFPSLLVLPFYSVGSGFIGVETASQLHIDPRLLLIPGIGCSALAAYGLLQRWRRGMTSASLLPVYVMIYGATFIASIAVSRGNDGVVAVMASRYYMEVILFIVGAVWLLVEDIVASPHPARWTYAAYFTLVIGLAGGYALSGAREWKMAPYRAASFDDMRTRLRVGTPDSDTADLLQSPLPHAMKGVSVMIRRKLAMFHDAKVGGCIGDFGYLDGWHFPEPTGIWTKKNASLQVPPCSCETVLSLYLPKPLPKRELTVQDAKGRISLKAWMIPGETLYVRLPGSNTQSTHRLSYSHATIPSKDIPGQRDTRELGALMTGKSYACAIEQRTGH
jgi:hypothetical protein